jgi:hypothetical protein
MYNWNFFDRYYLSYSQRRQSSPLPKYYVSGNDISQFLSLTADRCQLNVGRHLDSRGTDMDVFIPGAELISAHVADAKVLNHREPAPAAKIFDFSLQREVNQELGIK